MIAQIVMFRMFSDRSGEFEIKSSARSNGFIIYENMGIAFDRHVSKTLENQVRRLAQKYKHTRHIHYFENNKEIEA